MEEPVLSGNVFFRYYFGLLLCLCADFVFRISHDMAGRVCLFYQDRIYRLYFYVHLPVRCDRILFSLAKKKKG